MANGSSCPIFLAQANVFRVIERPEKELGRNRSKQCYLETVTVWADYDVFADSRPQDPQGAGTNHKMDPGRAQQSLSPTILAHASHFRMLKKPVKKLGRNRS